MPRGLVLGCILIEFRDYQGRWVSRLTDDSKLYDANLILIQCNDKIIAYLTPESLFHLWQVYLRLK